MKNSLLLKIRTAINNPALIIKAVSSYTIKRINVDIEVTNNCNTSCVFCPRQAIGEKGFMDHETYKKTIDRILEVSPLPTVNICGLGEPLMHPDIVDYVRYASKRKLYPTLTTNASLLSEELSRQLIDAGLHEIRFSISATDDQYKKIHKLDFDRVKENVDFFTRHSQRKTSVCINSTTCELNSYCTDNVKAFGAARGIKNFFVFPQTNRGGAYDSGHNFMKSKEYVSRVNEYFQQYDYTPICPTPFAFIFIGWNGNYYMCCNDFSKKHPLGSVHEKRINEIAPLKRKLYLSGLDICRVCDLDPPNRIREILFKIDDGKSNENELKNEILFLKKTSKRFSK
jgi:MoaA/NifB/PqqE/SkfB family radical SAM enzyme